MLNQTTLDQLDHHQFIFPSSAAEPLWERLLRLVEPARDGESLAASRGRDLVWDGDGVEEHEGPAAWRHLDNALRRVWHHLNAVETVALRHGQEGRERGGKVLRLDAVARGQTQFVGAKRLREVVLGASTHGIEGGSRLPLWTALV